MTKLRPIHAMVVVCISMAVVLTADQFLRGARSYSAYQRIGPDTSGVVRLDISDLERLEVRFFRFLNAGNQEVRFLVGRDERGTLQVGYDANDSHYKANRGFSYQDGWIIDNKCETNTRLSTINQGGSGCKPAAMKHRVEGDQLIITEVDMLAGWRYFR